MKDPSIEVWAEDEVHFQRASSLIRTWAPKGKQPRVLSPSTRQKIGFFGAVSLRTGRLLTQPADPFNTETFHDFIVYLLRHTKGKLLLILDNVSYHKARALKDFFSRNQNRIQLAFLPPYSPELNPIERIWRITRRRVTHNRYFPDMQSLEQALVNRFAQWDNPNETLKILCASI